MKLTLLTLLAAFLFYAFYPNTIISRSNLANRDTSLRPPCVSPLMCNVDNANAFYDSSAIDSMTYSYANPTSIPSTFHDVHYNQDPHCSPVTDTCTNDTTQLKYEVYFPKPAKFPYSATCKLPMVLLIHGGGFRDCGGNYYGSQLQELCRSFARRGFVAVTMDYRLGVLLVPGIYSNDYSVEQMLGIWRAGQDARGCLRTIIKRDSLGNEPYRIDTSRIYIGGNSAGSVAAMNVAFYNKSALLDSVYFGISNNNVLGSINQNYYFADTTVKYTIKGVLDLWGGVLIPKSDTSNPENFFFVNGNSMPPVIAFCGGLDTTFRPTKEPLAFPPVAFGAGLYNSTNLCLNTAANFTILPPRTGGPSGYILGSQNIYEMFKRKNTATEFYIDCDMGHGIESGNADFGIASPTEINLEDYFAARAITFFQAVNNGITGSLHTTKFVSCENYRNKCDTLDNNHGCSNSQTCP